jgi:hypothetical protein
MVEMAGEQAMGTDGSTEHRGETVPDRKSRRLVKLTGRSGTNLLRSAMNINTSKSFARNAGRSNAFINECVKTPCNRYHVGDLQ